jgi:hypothetical protein
MSDMMANHISARIAQEPNAFLINANGMLYEEISASLPRLNGDFDAAICDFATFRLGNRVSDRRSRIRWSDGVLIRSEAVRRNLDSLSGAA